MGPSTLVVKRGEYGAMLVDKKRRILRPRVPRFEEAHDPTGAGDSFAGGFMGYVAGAGSTMTRLFAAPWSWLGSRQLHGRALRPRAPSEAQKARDTRQGTPLSKLNPIQTLGGKLF